MIALPRRGWKIDIQRFKPFFIFTIYVLSSPRYGNDSSAGNKLSVVVRAAETKNDCIDQSNLYCSCLKDGFPLDLC